MSLHNDIMNIPADAEVETYPFQLRLAYKIGHRDARHAAAEMAITQDRKLEQYRAIIHELLDGHEKVIKYIMTLPTECQDETIVDTVLEAVTKTKKITSKMR